jgi:lipopolysaccharide export system permease protein
LRGPTLPLVTRIDRYLFRQLIAALLAITGSMVALTWLTQSLRFVELVVNRGLSLGVFLRLTSLLIPGFVAVILPITCFVAVQFTYQRLAGDRELTVMRAAGLSPFALSRPALAMTALAVAAGYGLTLWLVPASQTKFREFQWEIRNRIAAFLLQEGVFTPVSDDLLVYVRARDPDGTLHGILIDDARQRNHRATILAESGRLIAGTISPRVLLVNGSRQELDTQTGRLNVLTFKENTIDLNESSKNEEQRFRDIGELSLNDLLHPAPGLTNPREYPRMLVEAHRRLTGPLSTISYVGIALVSVLTGMFRRHGGLWRPLAAIMCVVALVAAGLALDSVAVKEPAMIPLMWVRALLPALACGVYLYGPALRNPIRIASPVAGEAD